MKRGFPLIAAAAAVFAIASPMAFAGGGGTIYDATVKPLPPNVPSVGAEAYSFTEFGDEVTFAGSARTLKKVTVTLSSWGCETGHWYSADCVSGKHATFTVPITFNIYSPGPNNTAGTLIATQTQTFEVPYRPSTDSVRCTGGRWFAGKQGCFNGLAHNITFDFKHDGVTLPDTVVYGIAYNTSHYGPNPIGESPACYTSSGGCPYDSLNIGLGPQVNVGSKPFPDTVFQNAVFGGDYCDGGADGVGIMRLDSATNACWAGYIPAVKFTASRGGGDGNDEDGE